MERSIYIYKKKTRITIYFSSYRLPVLQQQYSCSIFRWPLSFGCWWREFTYTYSLWKFTTSLKRCTCITSCHGVLSFDLLWVIDTLIILTYFNFLLSTFRFAHHRDQHFTLYYCWKRWTSKLYQRQIVRKSVCTSSYLFSVFCFSLFSVKSMFCCVLIYVSLCKCFNLCFTL